jgi:hypothetical protein
MIRSHPRLAWLAAGLFALAALFCVPLGLEAQSLLETAEDPVAIADRGLERAFDASVAAHEIEAALDAADADLAQSFVDLAADQGVALPQELKQRVAAAVEQANSAAAAAESFASGLITGEPKDMAGLAGTALGDLFVFGDVRDAVREGSRYVRGENYDQLILGLSAVGIAITAGTYATVGAATPARLGLTAVKAARKAGRLSTRLGDWIGRSVRDVVDWPALKRAGASVTEPAVAVRVAREAVKVEKADGLVRLVSDVGRVQTKAGTQAALDGLKLAESPREMSRIAVLAEKKGSKTRAILKTLGRGAILLSIASFNLAVWVLGAILTLFGFISSAKAGVERATFRHLARSRERRAVRYAIAAQARA